MNLQEMLIFVKVDNSFYTVLKEYERTKNSKIVLEKIFENLFTEYSSIEVLTNHYKDKKALDFFIGDKNEQIYLNIKKRIEKADTIYNLKDFMLSVILDSAYGNGKIYNIIYELTHLKNNSRNVYRSTIKDKESAKYILKSLAMEIDKRVAEGSMKFSIPQIKWLELIKQSLAFETKMILFNQALELFETLKKDTDKNYTKLINMRDFFSPLFLESISDNITEDDRIKFVKFYKFMVDNIKDVKPNEYNTYKKRKFGYSELFMVLSKLYTVDIPDEAFNMAIKDIVEETLSKPIPSPSMGREYNEAVYENFHLFSNQKVFKDYMQKSFEYGFLFFDYYKEIYPELEKLDYSNTNNFNVKNIEQEVYNKLKQKYKDMIGNAYNGRPLEFINKYPLKIKNKSVIEEFFKMYGKKAEEVFKEILKMPIAYLDRILTHSYDTFVFAQFMFFLSKKGLNEPEEIFLSDYIYNILMNSEPQDISEERISKMYSAYFSKNNLYIKEDNHIVGFNEKAMSLAFKFKDFNKEQFNIIFSRNLNYIDYEFSRNLFLKFYSFEDLVDFQNIAGRFFVYDINSFNKIFEIIKEPSSSFLSIVLTNVEIFLPEVIDRLLPLCENNIELITKLIAISIKKHPSLLIKIRDHDYSNPEVKNQVFNVVMNNIDKNKDSKMLPNNIGMIDDDKRKEALSILENAIKDLFPVN